MLEFNDFGVNQHGFRKDHSTETALLTLQSVISKKIENCTPSVLYSIDLSAAFDLLRPDTFTSMFKNILSVGLLFAINDFLIGRTFQVKYGDMISQKKMLDRGCVQGSVLGPILFNLYLSDLNTQVCGHGIDIITYADDTYVIVSDETPEKTILKAKQTAEKHVEYLRLKGMKVNMDKTEIMWLGKSDPPTSNLNINGHDFCFQNNIKALGITVSRNLSWDDHLVNVIQKGKKLMKGFRFIRKHLTEKQFLQTVTNTFFASTF